jgi:glycosyltransferase involved in cell wall biosynthesis
MSDVVLSILIPAIPERLGMLAELLPKLTKQLEDKPVELLVVVDNKKRPLGEKRNLMMDSCQGKYLTHLDDDDSVADDYIDSILAALAEAPDTDVLTFNSMADLGDGMPFTVHTGLKNENEQSNITKKKLEDGTETDIETREDIKRAPWHWCVWKTEIARQGRFPTEFMGEDWIWLQQVIPLCAVETNLPKTLHYYYHRKDVSLS